MANVDALLAAFARAWLRRPTSTEPAGALGAAFEERYGGPPTAWCRAPGRVDLMGSHTDYNEGHVLTMTVDRDTWLAVRPRRDGRVAIASLDLPGEAEFALGHRPRPVPWTDYVRGARGVSWPRATTSSASTDCPPECRSAAGSPHRRPSRSRRSWRSRPSAASSWDRSRWRSSASARRTSSWA